MRLRVLRSGQLKIVASIPDQESESMLSQSSYINPKSSFFAFRDAADELTISQREQ